MSYLNPDQFQCLQGGCPLSCCCGWRIGLDEATEQHWRETEPSLSANWFGALECRGEPEFQVCLLAQTPQGCCRLMDTDGLCGPHKAKGIDYKPETCRRFPTIDLPGTRQSLSLACPEAGRQLLENDLDLQAVEPSWRRFSQLRDFANGLFVDWHEVDSGAADKLWQWLQASLPEAVWQAGDRPVPRTASDLASAMSDIDQYEKEILSRYFQQSALHLGLPHKPYAGDSAASVTQLSVLLLALLIVLVRYQEQGIKLSTAQTGLIIAHLERQWGHPSSGLALLQQEPWLAQLDWREPLLALLVETLDV
jgi:hypothetical protein